MTNFLCEQEIESFLKKQVIKSNQLLNEFVHLLP
jgi:hypothetical protein